MPRNLLLPSISSDSYGSRSKALVCSLFEHQDDDFTCVMNGGVSASETPAVVSAKSTPSPDDDTHDGPILRLKFSAEEDGLLVRLVRQFGAKNWMKIAAVLGNRNPRQCRERYNNYLDPHLRQGAWTREEDELLLLKYAEYGCKWNKIGKFFVNRSDIALRNRYQLLARHRVKDGIEVVPGPRLLPTPILNSPAPRQDFVLSIAKECPIGQTRLTEDSFEMFGWTPFGVNSFDLFSDPWA
jgi:hypothetical protein